MNVSLGALIGIPSKPRLRERYPAAVERRKRAGTKRATCASVQSRAGQGRAGQSRAAYRDLAVCSLNGDILLQSPAILVSSVFELAIGSGQLQRSGRREKR